MSRQTVNDSQILIIKRDLRRDKDDDKLIDITNNQNFIIKNANNTHSKINQKINFHFNIKRICGAFHR